VTDLSIAFNDSNSTESFPSVLDLGKVTKLELYLSMYFGSMIDLLRRTDNIRSLAIRGILFSEINSSSVEEICSTVFDHVDRSKLRHLEVPVRDLNYLRTLVDRFRGLCSIRFYFDTESLSPEEFADSVKTLMPDCLILVEYSIASIWIGERLEKTNDSGSSTPPICSSLPSTSQSRRKTECYIP
jgi:hypothetical protein